MYDTYAYSNNLIVMRYKWRIVFFYWIYSLKDCLVIYIIRFLEREFPFEDRSCYHFLLVLSYTIVRKISWFMQYNKVGETMYKIMIVEDDELISKKLESFLKSWNYSVCRVTDFYNVMDAFHSFNPDLVLMDITLPYLNGYLWTEKIREESKVPIIFISSATDNMSIVMAISKGADDFVCKPFDLNVLAAKITAILRRSYDFVSNHNILEYQGVRFNLDDNTVSFQSSQMELSKNEAKILRLLMEKKGTIVSRDNLMEYLWKTDFYVDENALSVNVNRLRKKLESIGIVDFIQTKKGLGYKI